MPLGPGPTLRRSENAGSKRRIAVLALALVLAAAAYGPLPLPAPPHDLDLGTVRVGLAILILTAALWLTEALPLAVTALLVPVVASVSGTVDVRSAFANFSHPLIFLFLAGFGLAAALLHQGLDRWLAFSLVRLARGSFLASALALFSVSAFLSMWISNTAAVALLLPVALATLGSIATSFGQQAAQRATPFILLGVAYSASIGGIGTLIGTPPNAIAAARLDYNFAEWMKIGLPSVLVLFPSLFGLLWLTARPGPLGPLEVETPASFRFTPPRLMTIAVFALAVTGWMSSGYLGSALGIERHIDSLIGIGALVLLVALHLVTWKDIDKTADWGVLLLFGGGLTLSEVLTVTGSSRYLAAQLSSFTGDLPPLLMMAALILFIIFLTEIASNTASAALFVPIFFATALDLGIPPPALVIPVAIACSCAFMLPVATPPNALVFATGRLPQRTMIRIGLWLNLIFAGIVTLIGGFLL